MNEELQENEPLPEKDGLTETGAGQEDTSAGTENTESVTDITEAGRNTAGTVPENTEILPELPTVSANNIPSVPFPSPVEPPPDADSTGNLPAQPPDGNAPGELPAQPQVSFAELLENARSFDEILSAVRELEETVNAQPEPSGLPLDGYGEYSYPVSVVYRIFPPALGSETGYSGTYSSPEEFDAGYRDLQTDVQTGSLSYCYVRYVYDSAGECVYDSEAYSLPGIPVEGYGDYHYPVSVVYSIFPPDLGSETGVSYTYTAPGEFESGFREMQRAVRDGNLSYCFIRTIADADGVLVYDAGALPEQPQEPDGTLLSILESLGEIDGDLRAIAEADAVYRAETVLLQKQYTELLQQSCALQQENGTLQKESLASSVAIGFVLVLTLGYTVAHGFFQRMKVG